jgi:hypothetical protein
MPPSPPTGANLFRAKGLVYQGALDFWQRAVPGGVEAVRRALVDAKQLEAAQLISERIVAGGWYPVMPVVTSAVAAARLRRMAVAPHVRENAVWVAERDLRGVYKVILSVASIEAVAMRLGGLSMRYFDFGNADTRKVGSNAIESDRAGIPAALAGWFTWCAEGFVPIALKLAGAKSVSVRSGTPQPDGERHGVPVVRLAFQIAWT